MVQRKKKIKTMKDLFKDCENIKEIEIRVMELELSNPRQAKEKILCDAMTMVLMWEAIKEM